MKHIAYLGTGSLRLGVSALALLLVTGCGGWHLRGSVQLPQTLSPIYVDAAGALERELREGIARNGSKLTDSRGAARSILEIRDEKLERRVAAVAGDGKVNEYRLRYSLTYRVLDQEGIEVIAPTSLQRSRNYNFDKDRVGGSQTEEALVEERLREDVANTILRRLQRL